MDLKSFGRILKTHSLIKVIKVSYYNIFLTVLNFLF